MLKYLIMTTSYPFLKHPFKAIFKPFMHWYEGKVNKALSSKYEGDVAWMFLKYSIPALVYIYLRFFETLYELIFQQKIKKAIHMFGAMLTSFIPAVGSAFFMHTYKPWQFILLGVIIGALAVTLNAIGFGGLATALMAIFLPLVPSAIGAIGTWLVLAKHDVMHGNLCEYGTTNPEKYGSENALKPVASTNTTHLLAPTSAETADPAHNDDLLFKIIARRTYGIVKFDALGLNRQIIWGEPVNALSASDESINDLTYEDTTIRHSGDENMPALINDIQSGIATVTQKRTLLHFYQNKFEQIKFSDTLQCIGHTEIDNMRARLG